MWAYRRRAGWCWRRWWPGLRAGWGRCARGGGGVAGAFACRFGQRGIGALGGGDGVGAFGGRGGFVVVDEQDWCEVLFHVPADVVGQAAQQKGGGTPAGGAV